MNEEEKKAMELLENIKNNSWTTKYIMSSDSKNAEVLLNLIDKMKNCINILDDELKERNKIINEKEIIIEKLQKENKELKLKERRRIIGKYGEFEIHDVINRTLSNDYIPVQKVKDKIEEIQKEGYWLFTTDRDSDKCVEVLQQLLEKEQ